MVLVWLEGTEQYCVSCNNLVSSGCFGMIVCVCKLKTEQKILQYCEGKPISFLRMQHHFLGLTYRTYSKKLIFDL